MADTNGTADKTVRSFCEAWTRMDLDEMMGYFTEDAVYHNIPMAPMVGAAAIRESLAGMGTFMSGITFEIHRQVANGSVVMNERTDHITMGDRTVALPVMGVFELEGDKIKAWRDYFDMAQFTGA
jgi:limonene-1,2-epoxide hydrolase